MSWARNRAHEVVKAFRHEHRRHHPQLWVYVSAKDLADGLDDRIDRPDDVNQQQYGTCGPTAIVRDIICDDPAEYTHLTIDLFHRAQCKIHHGRHAWGHPLVAHYDLRRYQFDKDINPADWVLTATLRNDLDFARQKGFNHHTIDGTNFKDQGKLLQDLGYEHVFVHGDFSKPAPPSRIEEANHYLKKGYHVQIGINATIIESGQQDKFSTDHHLHWVELLTPITAHGHGAHATVSFRVFSWGKEYNLPIDGPHTPLKLSVFEKKFYGFIAARY